ncbi:hypothetical protein PASE110613_06320 [Paenibacillus sediminis]|uniref:Uncharacterized protein (DUF3084 family) n=1 Tax=Paenibacillus sediminis TaxID=664909 RepID=A0ABS4H1Q4_9BACL|nr:hypothetical protein [Paenibacillus sediminis]MBP1936396.1 uncharacterized protein (DUF3084 family) [Paenibacillus sediminis]
MSFNAPWFYIVVLGAIAIVYAMKLPKKNLDTFDSADIVKEVETTLEHYMSEIEQENEQLVNLIGQMKQETTAKQLSLQDQVTELRQRVVTLEQQTAQAESRNRMLEAAMVQTASSMEQTETVAVQAESPSLEIATTEDTAAEKHDTIKSRYPELFDLYEQGKSVDLIAKTTGLPRGEVQLILQLAKQEVSL